MSFPRALIFDCDGTLAHTMPLHWRAWQVITKRYQIHFPEERFYALGGVPTRDILRMLAKEQGRTDLDPLAAAREKEHEYLQLMPQVGPVQPVVDIAREYRGKLPMGVASGGSRGSIGQVLRHLGIYDWFQAVVTNEDVVNPTSFSRRPSGLGCPRRRVGRSRTQSWDSPPSALPGWRPSMSGRCTYRSFRGSSMARAGPAKGACAISGL